MISLVEEVIHHHDQFFIFFLCNTFSITIQACLGYNHHDQLLELSWPTPRP